MSSNVCSESTEPVAVLHAKDITVNKVDKVPIPEVYIFEGLTDRH